MSEFATKRIRFSMRIPIIDFLCARKFCQAIPIGYRAAAYTRPDIVILKVCFMDKHGKYYFIMTTSFSHSERNHSCFSWRMI